MATPVKKLYDRTEGSDAKELFYPETSAEAVMLPDSSGNTVSLSTYLANLASNLKIQTPKDGTSGKGIDFIENEYGTFPRECLSVGDLPTSDNSAWYSYIQEITEDKPTVWRRYKIHYKEETSSGVYTTSEDPDWTYIFCGTLGASGKTGTSTEYIYRAYNSTDDAPTDVGATYSMDTESDYQQSGYVPSGWSNTPPNIKAGEIIYVSQRTYNGELWSSFTTPSAWGTTGQDAENVTFHVVYTQVKDGKTPASPPTTATITIPTYEGTVQNCGIWSETTKELASGYVYWQSTGTFGEDGKLIKWTNPIRISGPTGRDGRSTECVYAATVDSATKPNIEDLWNSGDDSINSSYQGWYTSTASCQLDGINASVLWMAQRVKSADGTWEGDLNNERHGWPEEPILISIYGKEGIDGEGVQYMYLRLTEEEYQLIKKGYWNFNLGTTWDGETEWDEDTSKDNDDPEGVTRTEPATASVTFPNTTASVVCSITYADGKTKSSEAITINMPDDGINSGGVNYYNSVQTYKGLIESVVIDDHIYKNWEYEITRYFCSENDKKIILINNHILNISTSESEVRTQVTWDAANKSTYGKLEQVVIASEYTFWVTDSKNGTENLGKAWTAKNIENSLFTIYTPPADFDSNEDYWIGFETHS